MRLIIDKENEQPNWDETLDPRGRLCKTTTEKDQQIGQAL